MRLLKFPFLIQVQIVKQLELYEYFFLGLCSKKAKNMLQKSRFHQFEYAVIHMVQSVLQVQNLKIFRRNVVMFSAENDSESENLQQGTPFWPERIRLDYRDTMILCRITTHPTLQIPILWCKPEHKTLLPMALHYHICDVFHLSTDIHIIFRFSHLSEFPDTLEVDTLQEWATKPAENSEQFLQKINIRNGLSLAEDVLVLNTNHQIWSVNHLYIRLCFGITVDHLCSFRGSTVFFRMADNISNQNLVEFIKNWLNRGNRKLEAMMVQQSGLSTDYFDKDFILENFDTKPWDPEKRGPRFAYPDGWRMAFKNDLTDCTKQMDIERKSDGMLATIIITPMQFTFFVWHHRFPDAKRTKPILTRLENGGRPADFSLLENYKLFKRTMFHIFFRKTVIEKFSTTKLLKSQF